MKDKIKTQKLIKIEKELSRHNYYILSLYKSVVSSKISREEFEFLQKEDIETTSNILYNLK